MGETSDIVEGVMYLETAHFVTGEVLHATEDRRRVITRFSSWSRSSGYDLNCRFLNWHSERLLRWL
jgi:hypothetical protein